MSLKRAVAAGVKAAMNTVKDFLVTVEWTFVSSKMGDYDPLTDTMKSKNTVKKVRVLPYEDNDDDTKMMFSSRGNFVESPTRMDTMKVIMEAAPVAPLIPSVKDRFVWDGVLFAIDSMERVPGDSVYIGRASRV